MVKYTQSEIERVILLFRRYLTKGYVKLKPIDKEMMIKGIDTHKFTCFHEWTGMLAYGQWALPILLNGHPCKDLDNIGEGLDKSSKVIFDTIRRESFVQALVYYMDGNVNDKALIHASIIEAGHSAGVLPKVPANHRRQSSIKADADTFIKARQRKREKELLHI